MSADRDIKIAEQIASRVADEGGCAYYVGGFVRDRLLGQPGCTDSTGMETNADIDIEVHGISAEKLKNILEETGQVITIGKNFGIYSIRGHSIDVAMPRREKNTGRGHRDFEIYTDPYIGTLEATRRRDFTINALMENVLTGEITDHFGGRRDLEEGILRHVDDESFGEDPLRVFRGAQFAARFNLELAPETVEICRTMDVTALPSERVEGELRKALCKSNTPSVFFETLKSMDQLKDWFPEMEMLIGLEQDATYHPEGDVWTHTMVVLDRCAQLREEASDPMSFMLLALVHDLGKITTTEEVKGRIHSYSHETAGLEIAEKFLRRITGDKSVIAYVLNMVEHHMKPNVMAHDRSSLKSTNRFFDQVKSPEDIILFAGADRSYVVPAGHGQIEVCPEGEREKRSGEYDEFLRNRLASYREIMSRPYVTGDDLIKQGIQPGREFREILDFAHKLRLAGVDKESALKQALGQAGKGKK